MVIHHPFLLRKVFGMMIDTDKLASDTFLTYSLLKCSAEFSKFTEKNIRMLHKQPLRRKSD